MDEVVLRRKDTTGVGGRSEASGRDARKLLLLVTGWEQLLSSDPEPTRTLESIPCKLPSASPIGGFGRHFFDPTGVLGASRPVFGLILRSLDLINLVVA